jgi:serine/threonine-protein kinase
MSSPPGVQVGQIAGRYIVEREIGRGATAVVYLARDSIRGQPVAIKVLRAELAESGASHAFVREIRRHSRLQHPRILPVLDTGEHERQLYFVLPYMEGGTLRQRLSREKQLPIKDAVSIARTVAVALDYAHGHGLIHRDVKPENILFTEGEAYLADFGIARALEKALDDTTTSTGIVRGTVAYMSPEQASGEHEYDGRSDVYSLGCVLYEMLAGVPAFIGPTPEAVLAQRFAHAPRDIRVYRPSVSASLEAVVMKALQFAPADRFRTAGEVAEALGAAQIEAHSDPTLVGKPPWYRERRRLAAAGAAAAAVAAVVIAATADDMPWRRSLPDEPVDTTRLVVLPLEREGMAASRTLDDDLLHQALSRWRGIVLVDRFQVADAARRGGTIGTTSAAASLARSLGAGRYVRGRVTPLGTNSWRAYAALYDVSSSRALHDAAQQVPADLTAATTAYARLADSLLLRGAGADAAPGSTSGTRSLPAVQAFARAQRALDEWDLAAADSFFQASVGFDSEYARASLWLAQVRAWRSLPPTTWSTVAERAAASAIELTNRERKLAEALVMLGGGRYAAGCAVYDELRRRNDRDFAAWFGLGQCRYMDRAVVPDLGSPTGWRFRSSYHQALASYTRAFEILPSVHRGFERGAFERLRLLLRLSTDFVVGYALNDSSLFLGRLGQLRDTLILVPYPWQVGSSGSASAIPPGFAEARARQRTEFRKIAAGWSAAFPRSAGAKQAVAVSLELLGEPAAIDTMRFARSLASDAGRRMQLAAAEVLLLLKFGIPDNVTHLRAAQALADSLLVRNPNPSAADAALLAPLAALTGRCAVADRLARAAESVNRPRGPFGVAPGLSADAQALLARLALGCPVEPPAPTLAGLDAAISRDYRSASSDTRRRIDETLLWRPAFFSLPSDSVVVRRLAASGGTGLLKATAALARNDTSGVRAALSAFGEQWHPAQRATPDVVYPSVRLWLSIGDTATAIAWLDRALSELRTYDPDVLTDGPSLAALLRATALRADLAAARRDPATARRWATVTFVVWAGVEPDLRPVFERMSAYVSQLVKR